MKNKDVIILLVFVLLVFIVICSFAVAQKDTFDKYMKDGWTYLSKEQYDLAIDNFDKAISIDPSNSEAWRGKGYATDGLGSQDYSIAEDDHNDSEYIKAENHFKEANKYLEKAIQLNSSNYEAYINLAWSESMLRNFTKALELADKALEITPNNAEALNIKGTIYYRTSDYRKAAELFRKATTIDPKNADAWWDYCDVLSHQLAGDPSYADETNVACKKSSELNTA